MILSLLAMLSALPTRAADVAVDRNVVYGMYSGLALLMDVYRPAKPNGAGIVAIQGSAWYQPLRHDAQRISSRSEVQAYARYLAQAGYTVFAIDHRAAPRFRFPAQLEDGQRAVRFVRAHATEYNIDPERMGAFGSSSGGYLAQMLGTIVAPGDAGDPDPVGRQGATVRAVVTLFAPSDLIGMFRSSSQQGTVVAMMGFAYVDPALRRPGSVRENEFENGEYRRASPITHVSQDDAPMLLMHGDADEIVPLEQSVSMERALRAANVPTRLITVRGGKHGEDFQLAKDDPRLPDLYGEAARWFDAHLKPVR